MIPDVDDFPKPTVEKMFVFNETSCQMVEYEKCPDHEAAEHAPGKTPLTGK